MIFGLWVISRIQPGFHQNLPQVPKRNALIETLQHIENINVNNFRRQWNNAKQTFIRDIITNRPRIRRRSMNFYNDEHTNFIAPLQDFQTFNLRQICTAACVNDGAILGRSQFMIYLNKLNNNVYLDFLWDGNCNRCNSVIDVIPEFLNSIPIFLTVEPGVGQHLLFHEIPEVLNISNRRYRLALASIHDEADNHYVAILKVNDQTYFLDTLPRTVENIPAFNQNFLQYRSTQLKGNVKYHTIPVTAALYYLD